jgi:hypothetical protein
VNRIKELRQQTSERLRRLGRAYVDGLYSDVDYHRLKRTLEMDLESLVIPPADAAAEAGRLIENLPELWAAASPEERRKLLLTMLDAVYEDMKESRAIVAIKPKAPFHPIFQVAATREGSGVILINEPPGSDPEARRCFWWSGGRAGVSAKYHHVGLVAVNLAAPVLTS